MEYYLRSKEHRVPVKVSPAPVAFMILVLLLMEWWEYLPSRVIVVKPLEPRVMIVQISVSLVFFE